jgi:predicted negative regulator of RcsB-dependent stress response
MKKEVSPIALVAIGVVILGIVAFFGWRAFQPPHVVADSGAKPAPQANQQINGVNVPNNVPSYYFTEHQGQNNATPAPAGQ